MGVKVKVSLFSDKSININEFTALCTALFKNDKGDIIIYVREHFYTSYVQENLITLTVSRSVTSS